MRTPPSIKVVLIASSLLFCESMMAQSVAPEAIPSVSAPSGRELLQSKCGQCHTDSMWRDQRQDSKAWEATLYRMMGRGAVWSADDIVSMAGFLGTEFGPQVPKAKR